MSRLLLGDSGGIVPLQRYNSTTGQYEQITNQNGLPVVTENHILDVVNHCLPIVRGEVTGRTYNRKYGHNPSVGTTEETIWTTSASTYPYLPSAQTLTVSSTSASDASAGVGARTVYIDGLNASYQPINENVTLNGQTAVHTVNSFIRVNRFWVLTAGSSAANVGSLFVGYGTVTTGTPANILAEIEPGFNQAAFSAYTVPAGKTAYLIDMFAGVNSGSGELRVWVREFGALWRNRGRFPFADNLIPRTIAIALSLPEKTDFDVRAVSASGTFSVGIEYSMILVDNA